MRIVVSPIFGSPKKLRQLNRTLKQSGFVTTKEPIRGELGKGVVGGISTLLTGGQTVFTKLGDALIRHIENKKIDLTVKNSKGEELILSAVLPRDELKAMINGFFERDISVKKTPRRQTKNINSKKTTNTKKKTTVKNIPASNKATNKKTTTKKKSVKA